MSEWELRVSQRELHRMHMVRLTMEGRETVGRGAKLLGISVRQMKRLRLGARAPGVWHNNIYNLWIDDPSGKSLRNHQRG